MHVAVGALATDQLQGVLIFMRIKLVIAGNINNRFIQRFKPVQALRPDAYITGRDNNVGISIRRFQPSELQMYVGEIIYPHTKLYSMTCIGV